MQQNSTDQINKDDIADALARVLASAEFTRSKKIQELLSNIVDKTLDGKAHELKAYTIGLDVFNRDVDFDPEKDAIVRVEMGRLRKKLKLYYFTEGKNDPLQIVVPKGTYCPSFIITKQPSSSLMALLPLSPRLKIRMRMSKAWLYFTITAGGLLIAILAAYVFSYLHQASHRNPSLTLKSVQKKGPALQTPSPRQGLPSVNVYPVKVHSTNNSLDLAANVKSYLLTNLTQFKTLQVHNIRPPLLTAPLNKPTAKSSQYRIDGSLHTTNNIASLTISVVDSFDQTLLWSKQVNLPDSDKAAHRKVFEFLDSTTIRLASVSGVIWSDAMKQLYKRTKQHGSKTISDDECVMLFHAYDLDKEKAKETIARQCLERFITAKSQNGSLWAAWGFLQFLDWTKNPDNVDLAKALTAARTAVRLDPFNATSHQYLGSVLMITGKKSKALSHYRKAIELNRLKPDLHVVLGWQEVLDGDWAGGIKKIRKGVDAHIAPPGWMRIPLSIDAFKNQEYQRALFQADAIIDSGDKRGIVLALAASIVLNDQSLKDKYRRAFLASENADPSAPLKEIRGVFNVPLILDRYTKALSTVDLKGTR